MGGARRLTLSDVDLVEVVGRFAHLLHAAGVPVTPAASARCVQAITLARPQRLDEIYWLARVTLVPGRAHLGSFDRVFDEVFRGLADAASGGRNPHGAVPSVERQPSVGPPVEPGTGGHEPGPPGSVSTAGDDGGASEAAGPEAVLAAASAEERLRTQPFGACTPEELARLYTLMAAFRLDPPRRRSRRTRLRSNGRYLDLRATVRAAQRTGGDPVRQLRRVRRRRPRRVVLIADVSGSMEAYGRAYLFLLHSAVQSIGAEAFVFATRFHRLTRPLGHRQPAEALARAMAATPDWSGGTRIGGALRAFNDSHGRRGLGRGAVVVIVSDGWEAGDVAGLRREMERLSRLAYKVIWVNPRKQRAEYQPLVGGMAAALPYVDEFLSGHSLAALDDVAAAISTPIGTGLGRTRAARPARR
jgi:uncharacterized protein with von Willebrand factor type A (vWA) domain